MLPFSDSTQQMIISPLELTSTDRWYWTYITYADIEDTGDTCSATPKKSSVLNSMASPDVKYILKSWKLQHYSFSNIRRTTAHTLQVQHVKDLCLLACATMSHHSKRIWFRSNQHRGVTDISIVTALFIGGHKGETPDGICKGWGQSILSRPVTVILYMIHSTDTEARRQTIS